MRIKNWLFPAGIRASFLHLLRLRLPIISLAVILAAGCTRPASRPPVVYATESVPSIVIERVQVNEGSGIYLTGRSSLPDGECVKTELLEGEMALEWWPRDACVEIANGRWEFLAALGRGEAPERLDPGVEYIVHAWWPAQPETVSARFPFDLSGPPSPPAP